MLINGTFLSRVIIIGWWLPHFQLFHFISSNLGPHVQNYILIMQEFDEHIMHYGWDAIVRFKNRPFEANLGLLEQALTEVERSN